MLDAIGIVLDSHPHGLSTAALPSASPSDVPFIAPHAMVPQPRTTLLTAHAQGARLAAECKFLFLSVPLSLSALL